MSKQNPPNDALGTLDPVPAESLVVVAASAGGLPAMRQVLASLPAHFRGAVAIVQHRAEHHPDLLPELLGRSTALRVRKAQHGDVIESGCVYVCPPGMHMTARPCIQLIAGPHRRFVRPSADLMFESAAHAYGERAIAVVLSGAGTDGARGSRAIRDAGGRVIAQDPASCEFPGMPAAALALGSADRVPVDEIGERLAGLTCEDQVAGRCTGQFPGGAKEGARATVLLADDHRIVLDGLRALLRVEPDFHVVAQAESGRAAVHLAAQLSPDVVVMDIAMPDMNGIEATQRIKKSNPQTNIVALSARADDESALRILDAGALGFVGKDNAFGELATAIRTVLTSSPYLSPPIAAALERRGRDASRGPLAPLLTLSERDIVQLTIAGKTAQQIAASLGFTSRFVETRLARTMKRLGITTLADLIRYGIREGLMSLDS
jgi:chemotaxis response regulator CheB/DNA-binding CsgD family transcriptional regulator